MHITVDIGRCIGAGQCVLAAPEVFDQREDGLVTVLDSDPAAPADQDAVRRADRHCPSGVIHLHEHHQAI
jgi:ferredoxin